MQPYFFPNLGHFALIDSVDEWVVFDVTQYTPKTWMNRNRILHPKESWQYVTVPLSNSSRSIKTFEARVQNLDQAKQSVLGKLEHYKKTAPYFNEVNNVVRQAFGDALDSSLVSLNVSSLNAICEYLGIQFSYHICSELELEYPPQLAPGDWAPYISCQIGASEYVNPVGGKELFDVSKFHEKDIALYFAEFAEFEYDTLPYGYEPNLSILDVMMWTSPENIKVAIRKNLTLVQAHN